MFTGIIETMARVLTIETNGTNKSFWLSTEKPLLFKVDQSVSHNGVCLTVEEVIDNQYKVTAIAETLNKTNLGLWRQNELVNIEQCMQAGARFDGHFVSGHVDAVGNCVAVIDKNGSWEYSFEIPAEFVPNIIEKGSIAVNGTSLTIFNVKTNQFTVAIIPYTFEHTTIHALQVGTIVNLEFDMIGKYLLRYKEIM